jgi:Domain of unknown function (DUF5916)
MHELVLGLLLTKLLAPITLDGHVTDAEWSALAPLPLTQFQPEPGGPMSERSEIRVAYDDKYLYASARFYDRTPSEIRANSLLRDHFAEDDFLNLVIDTFHDGENAVWFIVTPNGTRIDGAISNNAEGPDSRWNHPEYDMAWDAVSQRTESGWSTELRIPLSTLRFESRDGVVTMGLIAARVIGRRKERHIFPAIRPTIAVAQFKPSLAAPVVLHIADAPRLATFTPYVLFGDRGRSTSVRASATRAVGADAKLGLSSRITLDLTANTDFAQTEVDDQRVNLTRFSLFFPERRQFFLERSGLFDVATGGDDRVFYSRRLGLGADALPTRVLGGGRLIGRLGQWDIGLLDLVVEETAGRNENAAVLRMRRNLRGTASHVGVLATSSSASTRRSATTVGADASLRVAANDFLVLAAASAWGGAIAPPTPSRTGSAARIAWEHRSRAGFSGVAEWRGVGADYGPALGFVARRAMSNVAGTLNYGRVGVRGNVQERVVSLSGSVVHGTASAHVESVIAALSAQTILVGGADVRVFARARTEVLPDTFRLRGDAFIPRGTYQWMEAGGGVSSRPGRLWRVRAELEAGVFYDGSRVSTALRPTWNLSRHLELGGDVELNRVWLPERQQRFRGDVVRLRFRTAVNGHLSLTGSTQYNRATESLTSTARLRFAIVEGTDLFIAINDERLAIDDPRDSRMPFGLPSTAVAGSVTVKYRHTFR